MTKIKIQNGVEKIKLSLEHFLAARRSFLSSRACSSEPKTPYDAIVSRRFFKGIAVDCAICYQIDVLFYNSWIYFLSFCNLKKATIFLTSFEFAIFKELISQSLIFSLVSFDTYLVNCTITSIISRTSLNLIS